MKGVSEMETEVTTTVFDYSDKLDTVIDGINRVQLGVWVLFLAIMAIAIFTLIMWLSQKFTDF